MEDQPNRRKSQRRKTDPSSRNNTGVKSDRRMHYIVINQAEIKAACDARMRASGMPINYMEESALKEAIKANRAEVKLQGGEVNDYE